MSWSEVSFGQVEEDVTYVSIRVKRSNQRAAVLRFAIKATFLSWDFSKTLTRQQTLIDTLNGPAVQQFARTQLTNLAEKVEHLVTVNDLLLNSNSPQFPFWAKYFDQLREQRDTLESIAESYRCAADHESDTLLGLVLETVEA